MGTVKKYAKTLKEARELYKAKTGREYNVITQSTSVSIFTLKKGMGKTINRRYYVGSYIEFINRH